MKHFKHIVSVAVSVLLPISAFAQSAAQSAAPTKISTVDNLISRLISLGDKIVYLLVAFAVLYIVYSAVRYFVMGKEGDESRREAGMQILWGIVGLFVIVSIWGLVNILVNTFPTGQNGQPTDRVPSADFMNGGVNVNNIKPASSDYFDTPAPAPSNSGLLPA